MGEDRKVYKVLVGKPEKERPRGILRRKWEDVIKIDLWETGWVDVEWIHLAQDREWWWALVNMVMNLWILTPWS
jgi:hypothetical protein